MVDNETPKGDVLKFSNQSVAFTFTEARINKLKPRSKTYPVIDTESGMYCYITPTGSKIFKTYKKIKGSPERITIGDSRIIAVKEARIQHRKNVTQIDAGINPKFHRETEDEPTIENAIQEYLETALATERHTPKTSAMFYSILRTLSNRIQKRTFSSLDTKDWVNWYNETNKKGKWSITHNTLRLLDAVWRTLELNGKPPSKVIVTKTKKLTAMRQRRHVYLSPLPETEQIGQFIHQAIRITFGDYRNTFTESDLIKAGKPIPKDFKPYDVYDPKPNQAYAVYLYACLFILLTGFRLRNALDLEWKDVDFKGRTIRIQKLKGQDKPVYFKMTKQILWLLKFRDKIKT